MAIQPILEAPDPKLRQIASLVTEFDSAFTTTVTDLSDTFLNYAGIGLAAPQIGASVRLLVMDLSVDRNNLQIFVNPKIVEQSGFALVEESCASVPEITGSILRKTQIRVVAQDANGHEFDTQLEGMPAVCLQHELDHLDGKLFIDRLPFWRRWRLRAA